MKYLYCFRILFVPLIVILITSCNLDENSTKKDILTLIQQQDRSSNMDLSSIENLDTINGFRGLKIGTHIDSLRFRQGVFNLREHPDKNLKSIHSALPVHDIEIRVGEIELHSIQLDFINNYLRSIRLRFGNYDENLVNNRFLMQLINVFDRPNFRADCENDRLLSSNRNEVSINVIDSASWVSNSLVLNYCYTFDRDTYNNPYFANSSQYAYEATIEYLDRRFTNRIAEIRSEFKNERVERERNRRETQREERQRRDLQQF